MWKHGQRDMGCGTHRQGVSPAISPQLSCLPVSWQGITLAAKHDHDVSLAAVDLGEGEGGDITPHFEGPLEGIVDDSTVQVRGVVHHPAGAGGQSVLLGCNL